MGAGYDWLLSTLKTKTDNEKEIVQFDWDEANTTHIGRHHISVVEAEQCILGDPLDIGLDHVDGEQRFAQVGETRTGRILIVIVTLRMDKVRVVTAFEASSRWRKHYLDRKATNL